MERLAYHKAANEAAPIARLNFHGSARSGVDTVQKVRRGLIRC